MLLRSFYLVSQEIKMHYFAGLAVLAVAVLGLYGFTEVMPADQLKQIEAQAAQARVRK